MRLLLDTPLLLWWLTDNRSLSADARRYVGDPENAVFVSAVSLWEIRLKQNLGKVEVPSDFEQQLANEPFESLPLLASHTREVGLLPRYHRDPFDRMLIAQARAASLRFLTFNKIATAYGDVVLLVA